MGLIAPLAYMNCWATQDKKEFLTQVGSQDVFAVQTVTKKYVAALDCDMSGGDVNDYYSEGLLGGSSIAAAQGRWFRIASVPNDQDVLTMFGFGATGNLGYTNDAEPLLMIVDGAGFGVAFSTYGMSLDTWYWGVYRVEYTTANVANHYVRLYSAAGVLLDEFSINSAAEGNLVSSVGVGQMYAGEGNGARYYLDGGICTKGSRWPPICPDFLALLPDDIGTYGDNWSTEPNVGAAKEENVDDTPPDGDTTYIYHTVGGQIQSFAYPASGLTTENILAVGTHFYATRHAGAAGLLYPGLYRTSALAGTGVIYYSGVYDWKPRVLSQTRPAGGEWTVADLDACEAYCTTHGVYQARVSSIPLFAAYGDDWVDDVTRASWAQAV